MIMATGIVSIASHMLDYEAISMSLFWLNIILYVNLWALFVVRLLFWYERFVSDMSDHARGIGYLTMVAGTCILGTQFVLLDQNARIGLALLFLGFGLWIFLIYRIFMGLTIKSPKPGFGEAINGLWLLATVSTESISVLCTLLISYFINYKDVLAFFGLGFFMLGGMFYFIIIILIFLRLLFYNLSPTDLDPRYWIDMGAVAITTLAGTTLLETHQSIPFLDDFHPFVIGFTFFCWIVASWWIPLLIVLSIWKHLVRQVELSYSPEYWSLVFPLGMYTTCTIHLSKVMGLEFLMQIPRYFIYLAFLAWAATCVGLLWSSYRLLCIPQSTE